MRIEKILKSFFFSPILLYCLIIYYFSKNRVIINEDLSRLTKEASWIGLLKQLLFNREFRNIFYFRLGNAALIPNIIMRENTVLHIMTKEIGGGLIVVHGDSTYINAKKIGKNFYCNQCVTIGVIGSQAPIIGDNVRVATGAIVLGGITIGNNVNIGAGTVLLKNVPDNCTVVGNPARIVKVAGQKVDIKL